MAELSWQGAPFVVATITYVKGSTPRGVGAKMLPWSAYQDDSGAVRALRLGDPRLDAAAAEFAPALAGVVARSPYSLRGRRRGRPRRPGSPRRAGASG